MASVLRSPALDSDRVRDASQPLLVDADWQQLLAEATEHAREEGFAAGVAHGRAESENALALLRTALEHAVTRVRDEVHEANRSGITELADIALSILGELTGELWSGDEALRRRVDDALAELDGSKLEIEVAPADIDHLTSAFGSDPRFDVVIDPDLRQGEVRIVGEWCHADLRWDTVLAVLREALGA